MSLLTFTTTTTTILRPFFRDHPGQPTPEENFWTLWCKGRLTEADTLTSIFIFTVRTARKVNASIVLLGSDFRLFPSGVTCCTDGSEI